TREADIPAVRFPAHRDGLDRARHWAGPPHRDPPDLREDQEAVIETRAVAELFVGEAVEAIASLEAGEVCLLALLHAAVERLIRLVEARQHVLEHMTVDGRILGEGCPDVLQLGFLLKAGDRQAAALPGGDALFESDVVELPAPQQDALQLP